jgi:hypothetical protein
MGELGWDDPKYDTSGTENMSDDEEPPNRQHMDQLERASIRLDSCSPPRRLVLSPQRPQGLTSLPSVLTRLKYPPNIVDRLSVSLDRHSSDTPPISSLSTQGPSLQGTSSMELDQEILDALSNDNNCSLVDDGYNSDPQDDLEIPEDQERMAGHHNGPSTMTSRPLMQLMEVALNLPVEAPAPIEPPFISPGPDYVAPSLIDTNLEISEAHTEADPDPIVSEPTLSPTPKGESMGSPTDA